MQPNVYYFVQVLDPKLRLRMEALKDKMQWTDLVQVPVYSPETALHPS